MGVLKIVVQGEQNHEREEHRQGRKKMPYVVGIEEVQQGARFVVESRLRRSLCPRYRFVYKEVQSTGPRYEWEKDVAARFEKNLFPVAELNSKKIFLINNPFDWFFFIEKQENEKSISSNTVNIVRDTFLKNLMKSTVWEFFKRKTGILNYVHTFDTTFLYSMFNNL